MCASSDVIGPSDSNVHTAYGTASPHRSLPAQVLLRALRDFNLGKLTADDTGIFMGLLNDLFPKTVELVPRAIDREFEPKVMLLYCRCHHLGDTYLHHLQSVI